MSDSLVDHLIWSSVVHDLTLDPDAAIYKLWKAYRAESNYLGVPLSAEVPVGGDEVQQPFSSGAVLAWDPVNGARLVT